MAEGAKPNRLIHSGSPYLHKHAWNPVDWFEWGEEALRKARDENKMIFLSIGYTACHWCNELEKECFSRKDFAEAINPRFVCVKVDREQRPDLDRIYMEAALALQGGGGWPNNLFLTPELDPVAAIGYRKRNEFKNAILFIDKHWREKRSQLMDSGRQIRKALAGSLERGGCFPKVKTLELAALRETMDQEHGGFGEKTKFPMTAILEFLLTEGSDDSFLVKTLDAMSRGGMFDQVGGGFHRYSTDREWTIPHFEKMLYDNALLALLYARAGALFGRSDYSYVASRTLDFIHRELKNPEGGFISSLDADSEGEEGRYYFWTLEQFLEIANDDETAEALGLSREGNMYELETSGFKAIRKPSGKNVIVRKKEGRFEDVFQRLFAERNKRQRPALDDKAVSSWHSMAVWAFARGGVLLGDPAQILRAEEGADFTLNKLKYTHSWRDGKNDGDADLDDAAYAAMAFWELFEATGKEKYLSAAKDYADYAHDKFSAGDGGYYIVGSRSDIIARPKAMDDNPTPNPAAILGIVDLKLAIALNDPARRERAQATADHLLGILGGAGYHSGQAMSLHREAYAPSVEIVYSFAQNEPDRARWLRAGHIRRWGAARIPLGAQSIHPSLREGRESTVKTAAFVCVDGVCLAPSYSPEETSRRLELNPKQGAD